jgi:hypothetical protein
MVMQKSGVPQTFCAAFPPLVCLREAATRQTLTQPFQGCEPPTPKSQGSLASSATLGFEAESRWDSRNEQVRGSKTRSRRQECRRYEGRSHESPWRI